MPRSAPKVDATAPPSSESLDYGRRSACRRSRSSVCSTRRSRRRASDHGLRRSSSRRHRRPAPISRRCAPHCRRPAAPVQPGQRLPRPYPDQRLRPQRPAESGARDRHRFDRNGCGQAAWRRRRGAERDGPGQGRGARQEAEQDRHRRGRGRAPDTLRERSGPMRSWSIASDCSRRSSASSRKS